METVLINVNNMEDNTKKRAEIVQTLLDDGHINAEEAVILLTPQIVVADSNPVIGPGYVPLTGPGHIPPTINIGDHDELVPYGEICPCNPKNGGSGVCGCIMGNKLVPRSSTGYPRDRRNHDQIG